MIVVRSPGECTGRLKPESRPRLGSAEPGGSVGAHRLLWLRRLREGHDRDETGGDRNTRGAGATGFPVEVYLRTSDGGGR